MTLRVRAHSHPQIRISGQNRPSFIDNVHVTAIAGYVAIAGIYWLPYVSHVLISDIKLTMFLILLVIGIARFKIYTSQQLKIYLLLLLCAIASFGANSVTGDVYMAISEGRDFIEILFWLIGLYGVRARAYILLLSRLRIALTALFFLLLYPVADYLGYLPNFQAPDLFSDPTGLNFDRSWLYDAASITGGGFNGGSTGWGATVAPAGLLGASFYLAGPAVTGRARIAALAIVTGSMASIVVTGARGGALALLFAIAYWMAVAHGARISRLMVAICLVGILLTGGFTSIVPERFVRNFDETGDLFTRLNTMSTGRLEGYVRGLEHFAESPLFGKGPLDAKVIVKDVQEVSVHNIWIRQLAEAGIIGFIPLFLLTVQIVSMSFRRADATKSHPTNRGAQWPDTRMVILCGLTIAMVEPSAVIGSFNANAVTWLAIWLELARPRRAPVLPHRNILIS